MNNAAIPELPLIPPGGTKPEAKPKPIAVFLQITALALGSLVMILGASLLFSLQSRPLRGEDWGGLGELILLVWCLIASVPIGLLMLTVGVFVKKGRRPLRWICVVSSVLILSPPVIALRYSSSYFSHAPKPRMTEERTEEIIEGGGVLTSQPLTLKSKTNLEGSSLLAAGRKLASPSLALNIVTGPVLYAEPYLIRVYVSTETGDGATGIKDSNYLGTFGESDPAKRLPAVGPGQNHLTFDILGGSDFYKLVPAGKPFSVILVPVGSAATDPDFRIPVSSVTLRGYVYSGR